MNVNSKNINSIANFSNLYGESNSGISSGKSSQTMEDRVARPEKSVKRKDPFMMKEISSLAEKISNNTIYNESASKVIAEGIVAGAMDRWA